MKKILILLLMPLSLWGQKDYPKLLDQYLNAQHDFFRFNGGVLVAKAGRPIFQKSFGYADFNTHRMLNDSSIFELASVSKQFTATGIIILKEKGLLNYDDDIRKYFPDLPYEHITVRNLLTHTSGIPSYEDQFETHWDHHKIAFNKDIVEMLVRLKDTLHFSPGSKWEYSNTGYALLASIIEKVSGKTYNEFLAQNIFNPLGMEHTLVYNSRRSSGKFPANYALGSVYSDSLKRYILPDSLAKLDMVYFLDGIVGDGCVNSTTGDLLKWVNSWTTNKPVSRESKAIMFSPLVLTGRDSSNYYGFGLMIQPKTEHGEVISHSGGWPGYSTLVTRMADRDETIIVLSNNNSQVSLINAGIESIIWDEPLIMPYEHKEVKIDPALLDHYVGKYNAFMTLVFIRKDDKLYRHREGTPDIELRPESNTKFFYADGTDRQIEFEVDSSGNVTKAWFINSGQKGELTKMK